MANVYNMKKGVSPPSDLKDVTVTAAEVNILDGATVSVADLNVLTNALAGATVVAGADAGTTVAVTIQLLDADITALATRGSVFAYLSDDANGDSLAATAPDGGIAIGSDGLAIALIANKAFRLTSEADGDIDLVVTESGADTWYLILVMPNGSLVASNAITFT